jgi:hypothetical protein
VAGRGQISLQQQPVVLEGSSGQTLRAGDCGAERGRLAHDVHAFAAAAGTGLDDERESEPLRMALKRFSALLLAVISGKRWHARLAHALLRRAFRAHSFDRRDRRPDEGDSRRLASRRELRVLRQKTIAGVDGVRARLFRGCEDAVDAEIALRRRAWPNGPRLVRDANVHGPDIRFRIHGGDTHAEAAGGARNTTGDLASVRDEQLLEHAPLVPLV